MGMLSLEEIEDTHYAEREPRDVTPRSDSAAALVQQMIDGPREEVEPEPEPVEAEEPQEPDPVDLAIMRGEDPEESMADWGQPEAKEDPA